MMPREVLLDLRLGHRAPISRTISPYTKTFMGSLAQTEASSDDPAEACLDLGLGHSAHDLPNDLATLEDLHGRY